MIRSRENPRVLLCSPWLSMPSGHCQLNRFQWFHLRPVQPPTGRAIGMPGASPPDNCATLSGDPPQIQCRVRDGFSGRIRHETTLLMVSAIYRGRYIPIPAQYKHWIWSKSSRTRDSRLVQNVQIDAVFAERRQIRTQSRRFLLTRVDPGNNLGRFLGMIRARCQHQYPVEPDLGRIVLPLREVRDPHIKMRDRMRGV